VILAVLGQPVLAHRRRASLAHRCGRYCADDV